MIIECAFIWGLIRAHLHQASVSTLLQLCYDASDSLLIENNGVTQKWVTTVFWSDSITFNENRIIAEIVTALTLSARVNGPLQYSKIVPSRDWKLHTTPASLKWLQPPVLPN